nr:ABC transporter D family member 2, chloroplastic [Tanacetum cinerariifolium]
MSEALSIRTDGISVGFNFLGRDFYDALANKDQAQFTRQLMYYLDAFAGGILVFVFRDYAAVAVALTTEPMLIKRAGPAGLYAVLNSLQMRVSFDVSSSSSTNFISLEKIRVGAIIYDGEESSPTKKVKTDYGPIPLFATEVDA